MALPQNRRIKVCFVIIFDVLDMNKMYDDVELHRVR